MSQTNPLNSETINDSFKELKLAYENPKLYIATYFSELRNKIDIDYETYLLNDNDDEPSTLANEFLTSMIDNVNSFEKDCLSKLTSSPLNTEGSIEESFSKLKDELKYLDSCEDEKLAEIDDLLNTLMLKVQKILFGNQQLVFVSKNTQFFKEYLETSDCEVDMVSFGFLVRIEDEFIGERGFIKQYDQIENPDADDEVQLEDNKIQVLVNLSNDNLKCDCLLGRIIEEYKAPCFSVELRLNQEDICYTFLHFNVHTLKNNGRGFLLGFSNLREILLSENYLERLDKDTFQGARNLEKLCLGYNKLQDLDRDLFRNLSNLFSLKLNENLLKSIDSGLFRDLQNLHQLNLSDNKLQDLDPSLFKDLRNLNQLDLSNNELESVHPDLFWRMDRLETLQLCGNKLARLDPKTLQGLDCLKMVYLSDNMLESLEPGTFDGLAQLERLYISNNQLSCLDSSLFKDLTNLICIQLHQNRVKCLEPGTFKGLRNLQRVSLGSNQLTALGPKLFEDLESLTFISFSQNRLASLEAGCFTGLERLSSINLNNNKLKALDSSTFEGCGNLKRINLLANDELSDIGADVFKDLKKLEIVYLEHQGLVDKLKSDRFNITAQDPFHFNS